MVVARNRTGKRGRAMIAEPQTAASETVFRNERGKVVVYWGDLDHLSRHRPITLMLAEVKGNGR